MSYLGEEIKKLGFGLMRQLVPVLFCQNDKKEPAPIVTKTPS